MPLTSSTDNSCRTIELKESRFKEHVSSSPPRHKLRPLSPSPGDWIVSGHEIREGETIVLYGNLIIKPGGNLTLIDCTLYMKSDRYNTWEIVVEEGGAFNVLESSEITAYDPDYEFEFYVYGSLIMRDSELHACEELLIETDDEVLIKKCIISHNSDCGIHCYRAFNVRVIDCTIRDNWYGVRLSEAANIEISGCTITDNIYGIDCDGVSYITISNCIINNNPTGIALLRIFRSEIRGCSISGGYYGIHCCDAEDLIISECSITGIDGDGIQFFDSEIRIERCTISYNSGIGINCNESSDVEIRECTIINNQIHGIDCDESSLVDISGCEIRYNQYAGIDCDRCYEIDISDCIISDNNIYGISCSEVSDVSISECTISNNAYCGVLCEKAFEVRISKCTVHDNSFYGVLFRYTMSCSITDNVFANNGIFIYGSGLDDFIHVINNNTVNGRPLYYIINTANYTVPEDVGQIIVVNSTDINIKNLVINYTSVAIEVIFSVNVLILGCTISNNTCYGVYCFAILNVSINYCNIYGNGLHGVYVERAPAPLADVFVNASYNWWGDPHGPEYKEEGDPADPEEIWGNAFYEPWLTKPCDIMPPTVQIIAPVSGSYMCGPIIVNVSATDNTAIDRVEFYINGTLVYIDYIAPYEYRWDTNTWRDGIYVLSVAAYDTSNNVDHDEVVIIVDNTPPECNISWPLNETYLRGTVNLRIAGGDRNLQAIKLYINNKLISSWISNITCTYQWDTTAWPDGPCWIRIIAEDLAGNIREITVRVIIDNTSPVIEYVGHAPIEPTEGEPVVITARVSDDVSGVEKVILYYRIDGGDWLSVEMFCKDGRWENIIPGQSADTVVEYYIEAYDKAGNIVRSAVGRYKIKACLLPLSLWQIIIMGGAIIVIIVGLAIIGRKRTHF